MQVRVLAERSDGEGEDVDTVVVPVGAGGSLPALPDGAPASTLARLLERGEASGRRGRLGLAHDHDGRRWLTVGTGEAATLDDDAARELAGAVLRRCAELGTRRLRWLAPHDDLAPALVQGTLLAAHRHERLRGTAHPDVAADLLPRRTGPDASAPGAAAADAPAADGADRERDPVRGDGTVAAAAAGTETADADGDGDGDGDAGDGDQAARARLEVLLVRTGADRGGAVAHATAVAAGQNACRRLQHRPPNACTPRDVLARARELEAEGHGLVVEAHVGEDALRALGMGMFAGVAQGSAEPPALIVVRWPGRDDEGAGRDGVADPRPVLGLVGKAVTHDTGGYSLKPGPSMVDMKLDMSGGAAVLEALGVAARLGLGTPAIGVIGATENLVSDRAMKPGDVLTAANGVTVEVTNTDAEGRLVLGDCLLHAASLGAERLVDLATLTGGVVTALGTSHAGLMGRDEGWLEAVRRSGEAAGERLWRLPLTDDHRRLLRSRAADLTNSGGRVAHACQGAAFLERFTGSRPWAHVDMAAMSHDLPRRHLGKGASGWGVRLLVELLTADEDRDRLADAGRPGTTAAAFD